MAQPTKIKTSGSTFKNPINQTNKKVWELIRSSVSIQVKVMVMHLFLKNMQIFLLIKKMQNL